jgi:enoyl-CoA hydratase/carnithine racemase
MHEEYRWCLQQAEDDPAVRVVVVTGEGRGFCAGADAAALDKHREAGAYDDGVRSPLASPGYGVRPEFDHPFAFQMGMRTPIIAAVNGPAAGIGLVVACFADLRFAAAGAKLTTAHGKLNLPAEYGLSWLLPRIFGVGRALDLLLSSRVVLAEEAERMGLVNAVLAPDDLLPHTYEYARMLAATVSPRSLAESKRQVWVDQHRDVGSSVAEAEALLDEMVREPHFAEGSRALSEKRPPDFT